MTEMLDAQGVADLLNVPLTWVQQAGLDGRLPSYKLGLYRRYKAEEILSWLESQHVPAHKSRSHDLAEASATRILQGLA